MSATYRAIGFDWSGVTFLYSAGYPDTIQNFFGIPAHLFWPVFRQHSRRLNTEPNAELDVWRQILAPFGKEESAEAYLDYLKSLPLGSFNTPIVDLIQTLRARGYAVGLLSNHTNRGTEHARALGVEELFGCTLFSADIGYAKPQEEAFAALADGLGVAVHELIFIDDSASSLSTANTVGFLPIQYQSAEQVYADLQEVLGADCTSF